MSQHTQTDDEIEFPLFAEFAGADGLIGIVEIATAYDVGGETMGKDDIRDQLVEQLMVVGDENSYHGGASWVKGRCYAAGAD